MFPGYTFNETDARLYPSDSTCIYCQTNESDGVDTNYLLPVYMEKGRTDLIVFRSVKYGALSIIIPRCQQCCTDHFHIKLYSRLGAWSAVIICLVLGFIIGGVYGGVIAVFLFPFIGIYVFSVLERKQLQAKGIESEKTGAQKVPLVQELMANGWTLRRPSA